MKLLTSIATISLLLPMMAGSARAENFSHTRQLLSTKSCSACDLSNAGLVMSDLVGAKLDRANLVRANFSRANLAGADLRGANLTGASFFGADLTGADLRGANLTGADLRNAYLTGANIQGTNVQTAYLQGTIGLPTNSGSADDFYRLGYADWQKNDFNSAVERYTQAIAIKPKFAGAYLGRSMAKFRLGNDRGAMTDALAAERIFGAESNLNGVRASQTVIKNLQLANQPSQVNTGSGGGSVVDVLTGLSSMLLKFF
jgi:uncharacterized protein YjbI with pentapeptide repeats